MSCTDSSVTCWVTNQTQIIVNIGNQMPAVELMISGAAYVMGIAFAVKGLIGLKELGDSRSQTGGLKEPLAYFLVSSVLIYLPTVFTIMLNSTFGYSNALTYSAVTSSNSTMSQLFGPQSQVGPALAIIIQTIGLGAFVRGWLLILSSSTKGQPPGGTGKGFTHIIGGIFAMNVVGTLQLINNTLFG